MSIVRIAIVGMLAPALWPALPASAQPVGSFRWQLQPYCNVVTLAVTLQAGQFQLDGTDDQCGAAQQAGVRGMAFANPSGSIGFGLVIVTAPGGVGVHVDATIGLATLGGTWRDSAGNSGAFVFTPGAAVPGTPRPVPSGGLAPNSVTSLQIAPGAVGPAQIAANSVTGAHVANGSLATADLADAPRAAFVSGGQEVTLPLSPSVLRTLTMAIPAAGTVVVNVSGWFFLTTATHENIRCSITTGTNVETGHQIGVSDFGVPAMNGLIPLRHDPRAFAVASGTFTVNLVCYRASWRDQPARLRA